MAPKKRPNESYAQYILRITNKPSDVYKPKPKPKPSFVEKVNKTAASNAPVSKVFKTKPPKVGSVEWMASQGKSKPKPKPEPTKSDAAKPKPRPAAPVADKNKPKPKPKPPANTTRSATVMRSPTGKEYAGPAFGERKAESKVGPIADGQKYSVQKTGKSVMQQQADELRKMGTKSESFKAEAEKARKESMAKSLKIKQEAEKKRRKGPRG